MGNTNRTDIWSRRNFIKAATPVVLGHVGVRLGLAADAEHGGVFAYVGSYTSAIDGGSNGKGIYRFEMDARTGAFTRRETGRRDSQSLLDRYSSFEEVSLLS